jgi:hypothetical protein
MYSISISNKFTLTSTKDVFLLPAAVAAITAVGFGVAEIAVIGATAGVTVTVARNNRGSHLFNENNQIEKVDLNVHEGISLTDLIQMRQAHCF